MKRIILGFVIVTLALVSFTSCEKTEVTDVVNDNKIEASNLTDVNTSTERSVAAPYITSIGGSTISTMVSNGKWNGNVTGCGVGQLYGFYVINTYSKNDLYNYWIIYGNNFGTIKGSIGTTSSSVQLEILSWSNTQIKVKPIASYSFGYLNSLGITIKTSSNQKSTKSIPCMGMLANGRGFGQCTWQTAYDRITMGKPIPLPSAYSITGYINTNYIPKYGDVVNWGTSHTAIIVSNPTVSTSNGKTTYSFQLKERNVNCNELTSKQTTQTFVRTNSAIIKGISCAMTNYGVANTYFR